MKILYVEDDRHEADLVRRELLKSAPHCELDIVVTEREALEHLRDSSATPYDLVLSDLHLPDGDGLAVLSFVRREALPVAVIIITGAGDEQSALAALKAGADDYIVKQEDYLPRLFRRIETGLQRYRAAIARHNRRLRVLYAEHSATDIDLTCRHLVRHAPHIQIEPVSTSAEVFHRLTHLNSPYDVLLLDFKLGDLNGLQIMKELHDVHQVTTPVVFVTGKGGEEVVLQAIRLGAADYVVKHPGYLFHLPAILENAFYRRQLEQERAALQETAERLELTLGNLNLIAYEIDADGRFLLARGRGLEKLGAKPDQAVGKSVFEMYRNYPKVLEAVRTSLAGEFRTLEVKIKERVWYASLIPVKERGTVKRVFGTATDITELEQLREQLSQSQKMEAIGRLAGGIAHDFNNLLTAILGYAELTLLSLPPSDVHRPGIEQIERSAIRASSLTRQLLTFARKQVIEPRIINLNDQVLGMEKMLRRLLGEDIELMIHLDVELWPVKIDPGQFEQILVNLAFNARDAMPKGGQLILETSNVLLDNEDVRYQAGGTSGAYVMLSVSDTGIGMTQEVLMRIFEPFFTTKEVGKGTGLGLATCYGVVKQNQGHIAVQSQLHKGSTFKIYLPRAAGPVASVEKLDLGTGVRGDETILLVEDEPLVRNLAMQTLRSQGYTVLEAQTGAEAIERAEDHRARIHLLLTDVVMPRMGGKQVAERLCSRWPNLKVLYISGYSDEVIASHGLLEKGIHFLSKPFTPGLLAQKVRDVLDAENHAS
jgi:two-component system, cell cycle sensor histidine kinase and response regulator CckA